MPSRDPLLSGFALLRPRLPRLALAVTFGVLALGSALALAGVSAWLIARAWQMPPILDLSIAVVAVRASASPGVSSATASDSRPTTRLCALPAPRGPGCTAPWPTGQPTP